VFLLVIILCDSLAEFGGGDTYDRIGVRIVVSRSLEELDAQYTFFEWAVSSWKCNGSVEIIG
jgi:hypothetical protein